MKEMQHVEGMILCRFGSLNVEESEDKQTTCIVTGLWSLLHFNLHDVEYQPCNYDCQD